MGIDQPDLALGEHALGQEIPAQGVGIHALGVLRVNGMAGFDGQHIGPFIGNRHGTG